MVKRFRLMIHGWRRQCGCVLTLVQLYSLVLPDVIKILKYEQLILHDPSLSKFFISAIVFVVPSFMSINYIVLDM